MSFEEFHKNNVHYSYLVAKIHYNLLAEQKNKVNQLILNFSVNNDEECESCSA